MAVVAHPSPADLRLSADAPVFVPTGVPAKPGQQLDGLNVTIPEQAQLRNGFMSSKGDWVAFYVGRLKTFSKGNGYGFIESPQATVDFGCDVFIHQNLVPSPWKLGQLVEFAVSLNRRGQPQASDPNWLPFTAASAQQQQQQQPRQGGASAGVLPTGQPGAAGDARRNDGNAATDVATARAPCERRHLGMIKSYSPSQGYGFIACEELFSQHRRDTYLDKNQVQVSTWRLGMCVEFTCQFNTRGHPQAWDVNLDPVPYMTLCAPNSHRTEAPRVVSPVHLEKLGKLLKLLGDGEQEQAVVNSIDYQGGVTDDKDMPVAYFTFVLDRLRPEVARSFKNFVKMLMILMVSKMLGDLQDSRVPIFMDWFEVLADGFDPSGQETQGHFANVFEQVRRYVDEAREHNPSVEARNEDLGLWLDKLAALSQDAAS